MQYAQILTQKNTAANFAAVCVFIFRTSRLPAVTVQKSISEQ